MKSTTRFRKLGSHKKASGREALANQRRRSGPKQIKAGRKITQIKRSTTLKGTGGPRACSRQTADGSPSPTLDKHTLPAREWSFVSTASMPFHPQTPESLESPFISAVAPYDFSSIARGTPTCPNNAVFYESSENGKLSILLAPLINER